MNFMQIYDYSCYRKGLPALSGSNEKPAEKEKAKHTPNKHCVQVCFLETLPLAFLHFHGKVMQEHYHVLNQIESLYPSQLQETERSYTLIFQGR